jgi:hypothetical protein
MFGRLFARRRPEHEPRQRPVPESKKAALENGLSFQVRYYKDWAFSHRKKALRYRKATAALGALVTVLLGLEVAGWRFAGALPQIAFVLSAVLTAVANMEGFQDPRGESVRFQDVYLKLLQLRARYEYDMAPPIMAAAAPGERAAQEDATVDRYWDELQRILEDAHAQRIKALEERARGSRA